MTRASLLHILNNVGAISEAEIRELEQLAAAFPYCQTAHLLLAKAAHDQGSMLTSQRLRRAATYAADRQLLRELLEQPVPEASSVAVTVRRDLPVAPVATGLESPIAATGSSTAFFEAMVTEDVQPLELRKEEHFAAVDAANNPTETGEDAAPDEHSKLLAPTSTPETATADVASTDSAPGTTIQEEAPTQTQPDQQVYLEQFVSTDAATDSSEERPISLAETEPAGAGLESVEEPAPVVEADAVPELLASPGPTLHPEDLVPAVAPPIRPPVGVGTSRFEFGLSEPDALSPAILYQLPGLDDEEEETDLDEESIPLPTTASKTALSPPFRADAELAYALLPGGSRCGHALQLRDEELTYPLPTTAFFPPDALLHAHSAVRPAPVAPAPSSFDLINRFLKVQPRLKSPGVLPAVNEQADLAARSTHAPPALATESLAKILVKQGKTDRAIEIYEQLMVRQPEKNAYFADQIQQLKNPE